MNQMAKLVHDDIFNAVSWRFEETLVQRDDPLLRQTGAPAGFHVPNSQRRLLHAVFLEQRIKPIHHVAKYHSALLVEEFVDDTPLLFCIREIPNAQMNIDAVR